MISIPTDASAAEEKDLLETFRLYTELSGGAFPDSLDINAVQQVLFISGSKFNLKNEGQEQRAKRKQEMKENQVGKKLPLGMVFAAHLPPEADKHYAGKGVSLGAADTPIFWYRPKDAKKYRVIYADLSVREADTPPSVPDAQPVPAPSAANE